MLQNEAKKLFQVMILIQIFKLPLYKVFCSLMYNFYFLYIWLLWFLPIGKKMFYQIGLNCQSFYLFLPLCSRKAATLCHININYALEILIILYIP